MVGIRNFTLFVKKFFRLHLWRNAFFNNFYLWCDLGPIKWRYRIVGVWQKVGKFHVDMFRSLENLIPSTLSITILVFVNQIEQSLCKMRFRENQFYKGNARPCFTKTKIVMDRVDGIRFSKDLNISTWNLPTFCDTPTIR